MIGFQIDMVVSEPASTLSPRGGLKFSQRGRVETDRGVTNKSRIRRYARPLRYVASFRGHNIIVLSLLPNVPPDRRSTDPMLGPLRDNGGATLTQALLAGSPAIDHADPTPSFTYDQRGTGFPRKIGAAADIGAFEFNADVIVINGFE